MTVELITSPAWRTAPLNTLRFVFLLLAEHQRHAGTENGNLVCTFNDCYEGGILRGSVKTAQLDAVKRGLCYQTTLGNATRGAGRRPSTFGIGWLGGRDGSPAPNRWKGYKPPAPTKRVVRENIRSSMIHRTKLSASKHTTNGKTPPQEPELSTINHTRLSTTNHTGKSNLPPGWTVGKAIDGHVRVITDDGVGVPVVAGVGSQREQEAFQELCSWQDNH
jgi:hypothetical protein